MSVVTVIDPCPLECGRSFHGLPLEATKLPPRSDCPGPWGPPTPGQAPGNAVTGHSTGTAPHQGEVQ